MTITTVGTIGDRTVKQATLSSGDATVTILSYGAILRDWRVTGPDGVARSVTLGFADLTPYAANIKSFGIVAGRIANRVRDARFTLDGAVHHLDVNHGRDHLHGGAEGLGKQHYLMGADGASARLIHESPDGAMGYPGNVTFTFDITLKGHTLTFDLRAVPDRPTPIALAQHSYYRLGAPLAEHRLTIAADTVTSVDARNIPTGAFTPVAGGPLDFRTARTLGNAELDHNFCLTGADPAAVLETELYRLTLSTDRPGLQAYSAYNFPRFTDQGHDGAQYGPHAGLALEAQDYPNAVNIPDFGNVIATPEAPYRQVTSVTIAPQK
ncbi:MAG: aldose epimerase family protein [Pseudomonadota bacterium]